MFKGLNNLNDPVLNVLIGIKMSLKARYKRTEVKREVLVHAIKGTQAGY